jgi:hypothetical protein
MNSRSIIAMLLAYVIPGGGHFYLGRRARAAGFFAIIVFLFCVGLLVDGRLATIERGNLLSLLATLGSMGAGPLYFVGRAFGGHGDITSITFEYGTAFTLTAGLMNLLLVLDAYDIAEGRKE